MEGNAHRCPSCDADLSILRATLFDRRDIIAATASGVESGLEAGLEGVRVAARRPEWEIVAEMAERIFANWVDNEVDDPTYAAAVKEAREIIVLAKRECTEGGA